MSPWSKRWGTSGLFLKNQSVRNFLNNNIFYLKMSKHYLRHQQICSLNTTLPLPLFMCGSVLIIIVWVVIELTRELLRVKHIMCWMLDDVHQLVSLSVCCLHSSDDNDVNERTITNLTTTNHFSHVSFPWLLYDNVFAYWPQTALCFTVWSLIAVRFSCHFSPKIPPCC